jgi:transketolase
MNRFVIPPEIYRAFDARAKGAAGKTNGTRCSPAIVRVSGTGGRIRPAVGLRLSRDWETMAWEFIHATQQRRMKISPPALLRSGLEFYGPHFPSLVGGSADLAESTGIPWAARGRSISSILTAT